MAVSKHILIISISVFLSISLSCAKKRDESSKAGPDKPSTKSFGTPETYYGDPDRIGELKKAVVYFVREQKWQDAETTLRVIIDSNQTHNDKRGLVNNYCFLGLVLRMQGKQEQELDSYKRELEIARSLLPREPAWECDALINMGGVQLLMGQFEDAKESLENAKKIAQENSLDNLIPQIDHNLRIAEQKLSAVPLFGQPPKKRKGAMDYNIEKAREVVKILQKSVGKGSPSLNSCAFAIQQPDFPAVIGEEGCIVKFDDKGEPIFAITTRVHDYKTGIEIRNRQLTDREIKQAASSLRDYYQSLGLPSDLRTIVIFSNSFRAAACEAVLNMAQGKEYLLKREGKIAKMYKVENGQYELIAAEMIYYEKQ